MFSIGFHFQLVYNAYVPLPSKERYFFCHLCPGPHTEGREGWTGSVRGTGAEQEGGCPDQPATVLWQVDPG